MFPEWFGAVNDGGVNSAPAIAKAYAAAQAAGTAMLYLTGTYGVGSGEERRWRRWDARG